MKKICISTFALMFLIIFTACEKGNIGKYSRLAVSDNEKNELYQKLMDYLDHQYHENKYVKLHFSDKSNYIFLYYDYMFDLQYLYNNLLKGDSPDFWEGRVRAQKEELLNNEFVRQENDYILELKKAKEFETYIALEGILKNYIEYGESNDFDYYKEKIDLILLYILDENY